MNNTINNKQKNNLTLFKFLVLCVIFVALGFGISTYANYTYTNNMSEFYSTFNKYDFDKALTIINNTTDSNILKRKQIKSDLKDYFTNVVDVIVKSIESGKISDSDAIPILSEIKKYDVLNSSLDRLIASLDSNYAYNPPLVSSDDDVVVDSDIPTTNTPISENNNLALGITAFENKDYQVAISHFNNIPKSLGDDFNKAKEYIENCKKNYKTELLSEAEELIANKYYTDALAFLSSYDTSILGSNDKDISNKINSVEMFRDEYNDHIQSYPNDESAYASTAILQSISTTNVNTLNISSETPYFVYLSLADQTTYIYEGGLNNWKLTKSFLSSTGLPGKETPKGIFSISGRDTWFFAQEFQQGGKYWVRFMGDYLFHSVPYNETQTEVLDETLGVAASHGCVRLKVEDAKWIYDNIADGTKVIIN